MAEECMVCLDTMKNEVVLKCGHKMCKECLKQLYVMTCPYCRSNMITSQNINKVITNIINKVIENEPDNMKCNQISRSIDELYGCLNRKEITVLELTKQILTTMMDISDITEVKRIIKEETYISVIDKNY